ncbi:amidase [Erythrobacter sp. BLCC-B19]|uniref:amidase n=1 Tax=Erythrobacter sp. BLCC-B19 TaxID=3025315 RepID=UPI002362370A|nr:amidase [Erythrobacter sp. BLCC-B19]WDA41642.1 amidase [Erythrobacter sp. BLCC-B19]
MTSHHSARAALALLLASTAIPGFAQSAAPPAEATAETRAAMNELLAADEYILRIQALDDNGPRINAVIDYDPTAPVKARQLLGTGVLRGRTVLVKDNVETAEWPTTAGSLALKDNATGRDAPLIALMRANGGVVLGKTNLSEWANIRSDSSTSGWSAVGGLSRNPHAIDRNTCGSSSGSGAAVAAGFAWAAIGTETNGSITCPASINGIVGFKPSVGIVSRTHVVPISSTQDTAGPMARTVYDAALLLTAIAGEDKADPVTLQAKRVKDYTAGLDTASLDGVRIGVLRGAVGSRPDVSALFEDALADLTKAGAVLVDVEYSPPGELWQASLPVLLYELRAELDKYLAGRPGSDGPRSLADVVSFNIANEREELRWFGQELFLQALDTDDAEAYAKNLATLRRLSRAEGIDKLLKDNDVTFLIAPTAGPAWSTDLVNGDNFAGRIGAGYLAAIAGYPHLTVPMGAVERLPVGLSIMGGQWQDHAVLKAGAAYEKARSAKLPAPTFRPWRPAGE